MNQSLKTILALSVSLGLGSSAQTSGEPENNDPRPELRIVSISGKSIQILISTPTWRKAYTVKVGDQFGAANEFQVVSHEIMPRVDFGVIPDRRRIVIHHQDSDSNFELRPGEWSVFIGESGPEWKDGRSAKKKTDREAEGSK